MAPRSRCWKPTDIEALAPEPLRETMGWQEFVRLSFGSRRPHDAIPIGLEGDWLDRFGALLGEHGRFTERQITLPGGFGAPGDPHRILDHALDLPNAVWRLHSRTATFTRCLVLAFRYTALSDEKREGLIWIAFNLATGAAIDEIAAALRGLLAQEQNWQAPEPEVRVAAGPGWDPAMLQSRVRPLLTIASRRIWGRSYRRCAGDWNATAIACTPIMTNCAASRSSDWQRFPALMRNKRKPSDSARHCG